MVLDKEVVIESCVSQLSGDNEKEKRQCPLNVDFSPLNNILEKKSMLIFLSTAHPVAIFSMLLLYNV